MSITTNQTEFESVEPIPMALMALAESWAQMRSKDPKTKVGALIYDWSNGATYLGYNGFPKGIPDQADWWLESEGADFSKHELVIHAESNAVRKALHAGAHLQSCELFVTHAPCLRCAVEHIVQTGIKRVTYKHLGPANRDLRRIKQVFGIARVELYNLQERLTIRKASK